MSPGRYRLDLRPRAERQFAGPPRGLPVGAASAVLEFILGPLLDNPRRVGKPLRGRYEGQHSARCSAEYRVRYVIDDANGRVTVLDISRRADTYGVD